MLCKSHWDTTLFGLSSLRIYLTLLFENLPWYRAQEANEQVWGTRPLAGWVGVSEWVWQWRPACAQGPLPNLPA